MSSLEEKVVLVTGAARGIGKEVALLLAREGARVLVNDIGTSLEGIGSDASAAAEAASQIVSLGGVAVANTDTVASPEGAAAMVRAALDTFGRLDCVVNNAGITRDALFHKMSDETWNRVVRVHLDGSFNVSRRAAEVFRAQESGAFVHIVSNAGLVGALGQANYAAAKLGMVGLSRSIAIDMARFNVRSNCVAPFAWSRMVEAIKTDDPVQAARVARIREMPPSTVAPVVAFLLSDEARDVTGQVLTVRKNEILLMSQPRPVRSLHDGGGWTVEKLAARLVPALKKSFTPLEVANDVYPWDPI